MIRTDVLAEFVYQEKIQHRPAAEMKKFHQAIPSRFQDSSRKHSPRLIFT